MESEAKEAPPANKQLHRNEAYMDFEESVVSNVQNMLDEIDADMNMIDSVENQISEVLMRSGKLK